MAENSKIEWTDHTVNLWWGCAKVHTGCKNCYADTLSRRWGKDVWGEKKHREVKTGAWKLLWKIQKIAETTGVVQQVFVGSMMDIFEESKPTILPNGNLCKFEMDGHSGTGWRRYELFASINAGSFDGIQFLFLTKRPENIQSMILKRWISKPPENVWIGTSCSDQETFDTYSKRLIENWSGNKFLSIEPQVGNIIDFNDQILSFNWIIQGGESGHKKRPFNIMWAEYMKAKCEQLKVPYFFKQIDKVQEIPENLKIRQFPGYISF